MTTLALYEGLLGLVIVERCIELGVSRRNAIASVAHGGVEVGRGHYPVMVVLHTLFLASAMVEPVVFARAFVPAVGVPAFAVALGCQGARWWCVATLGPRWNVRVIVVPGLPRVTTGPYRYLAHPNYLAVWIETLALPLVHSAWLTAVLFGSANTLFLRQRMRIENAALVLATSRGAPAAAPPPAGASPAAPHPADHA